MFALSEQTQLHHYKKMSSRSPEWEHNSFDDSVSGMDWYNYSLYSRDGDDEYTLEELKHLDKETRESIIDYTVEDEFDIFDVLDDGNKNQEEVMMQTQVHTDLKVLIEQLPKNQKEVLKMRYFEDLSFKQISDLTGTSINTALGRMRYALINLRKLAEKQHIDLQVK